MIAARRLGQWKHWTCTRKSGAFGIPSAACFGTKRMPSKRPRSLRKIMWISARWILFHLSQRDCSLLLRDTTLSRHGVQEFLGAIQRTGRRPAWRSRLSVEQWEQRYEAEPKFDGTKGWIFVRCTVASRHSTGEEPILMCPRTSFLRQLSHIHFRTQIIGLPYPLPGCFWEASASPGPTSTSEDTASTDSLLHSS